MVEENKVIVKRKIGRPVGSRPAERALRTMKVQEIINLSEGVLLRVLKGETNLPLKMVAEVALELYKRRVPAKSEESGKEGQITMIKIIKNHIPSLGRGNINILPDEVDQAAEAIIMRSRDVSSEPDET